MIMNEAHNMCNKPAVSVLYRIRTLSANSEKIRSTFRSTLARVERIHHSYTFTIVYNLGFEFSDIFLV
jgi:hypothetical protein